MPLSQPCRAPGGLRALGLTEAFSRVIGLVVQPGVEFGHDSVIHYAPEKARDLSRALGQLPGIVFEGPFHRIPDRRGTAAPCFDGFLILKVGPW